MGVGKTRDGNSAYSWDIQPDVYNAYVKEAQERLITLGYKLPKYGADGKWSGSGETYNAILSFQTYCKNTYAGIQQGTSENRKQFEHYYGVAPTGKLDKATYNALEKELLRRVNAGKGEKRSTEKKEGNTGTGNNEKSNPQKFIKTPYTFEEWIQDCKNSAKSLGMALDPTAWDGEALDNKIALAEMAIDLIDGVPGNQQGILKNSKTSITRIVDKVDDLVDSTSQKVKVKPNGGSKAHQKGIGGNGWRGDKIWKGNVNTVKSGGTIENLNGKVPTQQEAIDLIKESGGKVNRIEGPHEAPNPHNFDHINYTTPEGKKGTIKIQGN